MSKSKKNSKKHNIESSQQDLAKSPQKPTKTKKEIPDFKEEDLYKVKYDF